ncbi:MAG: DeoR family transcriptional regulator [Patescibacteria group bacterium]
MATPTQSSPPTPAQQPRTTLLSPNDLALRGLAARRARREARLQKILELVKKEGSIGSLDVQKYLHVSDSTATRYLKELVAQGKLKRVGSPSHARYEIAG